MEYFEKIVNAQTGEEIIRPYTIEEIEASEIEAIKIDKINESLKAESEAKANARAAILDRLGLTADEVAILLG
jgi:hypothetical protein